MTRLKEDDIQTVGAELGAYDGQLLRKVGTGLAGIAAHALGKSPGAFYSLREGTRVGVIPVSSGQGIINGFSAAVRAIIEFLGYAAFVTELSDVRGLAEAVQKGARIVFLADDAAFVAINLASGKVSDNGEATGRGYAAALDIMAGGVAGSKVLLLGAGPVGAGAAAFLTARGARVLVSDPDGDKAERLRCSLPGVELAAEEEACELIVEATPAANTIDRRYITNRTKIVAPGIPLGLNQECCSLVADRLVHDVLEIGVATMLLDVLSEETEGRDSDGQK